MDERANNQIDPVENNGDNVNDNCDIEDEDVEVIDLEDENVLQRLKRNDPSIIAIEIGLNCFSGESFFNSIDWKKDSECISTNTHLKKLRIYYYGQCLERSDDQPYILGEQGNNLPTRQQLRAFFSCIYQNSSIKQVCIYNCCIVDEFSGGLIQGLSGHPSLERLEIELAYDTIDQSRLGGAGCTALGQVLKHPQSKLKDLCLPYCKLDDNGLGALCDGLLGNSTMKSLRLKGNTQITSTGWRALSAVLHYPKCKLIELDLRNTEISDEGSNILGSALSGSSSIRVLDLSYNNSISSPGWQTLLNQLSQLPMEKLHLNGNKIDDDGIAALANISTVNSLELVWNSSVTSTGWRSFFSSLQTRAIQLVTLVLSGTSICNEGVTTLGRLLSNMSSLKVLDMDSNHSITPQGWQTFFNSIQDSNSDMVRLSFRYNNINYGGLQLLVRLVSNMNSLRRLRLGSNQSVTPVAWQVLTGYLQRPSFVLKSFDLSDNNIDDDALIAFAGALEHNKTLKQVDLEGIYDDETDELVYLITEKGWGAVSTLLCNKTSILKTYTSNHTLKELGSHHDDMNLPDDLVSYLELNENKDKAEVARQKILQTHFTTEDSPKMQVLLDMALEVMPIAIEWIGKPTHDDWKGERVSGLSAMYNLTRRLPDLFDLTAQKEPLGKRKRGV